MVLAFRAMRVMQGTKDYKNSSALRNSHYSLVVRHKFCAIDLVIIDHVPLLMDKTNNKTFTESATMKGHPYGKTHNNFHTQKSEPNDNILGQSTESLSSDHFLYLAHSYYHELAHTATKSLVGQHPFQLCGSFGQRRLPLTTTTTAKFGWFFQNGQPKARDHARPPKSPSLSQTNTLAGLHHHLFVLHRCFDRVPEPRERRFDDFLSAG